MKLYEARNGSNKLLLFPRGTFQHPQYGELVFDDSFFDEIIGNFHGKALGNTLPYIDVDHEHQEAAAWIHALSKDDAGLWASHVEWTDLGRELVQSGRYRYFSPWWGQYKDPGTGKKYDRVLRGGGLTNVPFLKILPEVQLYEPGEESPALLRAREEGIVFQLSELECMDDEPSMDRRAQHVRDAFARQFASSYSPMASSTFVQEVHDDKVICTVDDGHGPKTYAVPYSKNEDGGVDFDVEKRKPVRQAWVDDKEASDHELMIRLPAGWGMPGSGPGPSATPGYGGGMGGALQRIWNSGRWPFLNEGEEACASCKAKAKEYHADDCPSISRRDRVAAALHETRLRELLRDERELGLGIVGWAIRGAAGLFGQRAGVPASAFSGASGGGAAAPAAPDALGRLFGRRSQMMNDAPTACASCKAKLKAYHAHDCPAVPAKDRVAAALCEKRLDEIAREMEDPRRRFVETLAAGG